MITATLISTTYQGTGIERTKKKFNINCPGIGNVSIDENDVNIYLHGTMYFIAFNFQLSTRVIFPLSYDSAKSMMNDGIQVSNTRDFFAIMETMRINNQFEGDQS